MLDNTPNQLTKFRAKNWFEINDDARCTYSTKSQIKFKTLMLEISLCDSSDAYILVRRTITVRELAAGRKNNGIEVMFKNCAPFTDYISEVNNTQIDNAKYIYLYDLFRMYNLIKFSDNV